MPIYVYQSKQGCDYCQQSFEQFQSITDAPLTQCPKCQAQIQRVIQAVGMKIGKKHMLQDSNLKKHGFTKLVNEGGGKFRKI